MTTKDRTKMIECWIKEINPNAFLQHADGRCGGLCAIAINRDGAIKTFTQFMTLKEMEKVLMFALNHTLDEIKNA